MAFPPVPNSRAITWRMLEPALPASRCQIVTLPLAITPPRCVLRLRSPVSWLTFFSVPGFSAALVLFLSTSPVILQTKGYTLTSLPGLPTCSSCLPWISPHLWTTWNLDPSPLTYSTFFGRSHSYARHRLSLFLGPNHTSLVCDTIKMCCI